MAASHSRNPNHYALKHVVTEQFHSKYILSGNGVQPFRVDPKLHFSRKNYLTLYVRHLNKMFLKKLSANEWLWRAVHYKNMYTYFTVGKRLLTF